MPRTKGARDLKKRKHRDPASYAHSCPTGYASKTVRISAPKNIVAWFSAITAQRRGEIISAAAPR